MTGTVGAVTVGASGVVWCEAGIVPASMPLPIAAGVDGYAGAGALLVGIVGLTTGSAAPGRVAPMLGVDGVFVMAGELLNVFGTGAGVVGAIVVALGGTEDIELGLRDCC